MNKKKRTFTGTKWAGVILCLSLVCLISACGGKKGKEEPETGIITVTIEPLRFFTEAIAGDRFVVKSMVPKGASPETYDPTPRQLMELKDSKAYFRIGYIGFEITWMDRLMENAPHLSVFDLSNGIDLIFEAGHAHGDHYHPGGVEPHLWCSAVNAQIIATNIFNALCRLDQEGREYYEERYNELYRAIEKTGRTISDILKNDADTTFMIYHPALSYFAKDYGLRQIAIEEGGKEPSPAHLKELIKHCREEGARVIFIQPEFDRRNAELIANETGTRVVPINPLSYQWPEEMIHIAKSLNNTR